MPRGVVRRAQAQQYANVFVRARIGLPDVPLIRRRQKRLGKAARDRMVPVFHDKRGGKRRPAIGQKHRIEKVADKPGPIRALVVVAGEVEA